MSQWKWNGSRWWKFDFHTHTPASVDYGKGPDQERIRAITPEEWVLGYMRAGIDCVAITDHNIGSWIDRTKEALAKLESDGHEDFRPLYLFPGMEISVYGGIHVLAVLDPTKNTSDLDVLRGAVLYQGTEGTSDGVTQKSLVEVVASISATGGIAIPVHVNEDRGLFRETGPTLQQALECDAIFSMEVVDPGVDLPQAYLDSKNAWTSP